MMGGEAEQRVDQVAKLPVPAIRQERRPRRGERQAPIARPNGLFRTSRHRTPPRKYFAKTEVITR
jgi:hypothetical protein